MERGGPRRDTWRLGRLPRRRHHVCRERACRPGGGRVALRGPGAAVPRVERGARCSAAGVGWWRHRRGEPPGRGTAARRRYTPGRWSWCLPRDVTLSLWAAGVGGALAGFPSAVSPSRRRHLHPRRGGRCGAPAAAGFGGRSSRRVTRVLQPAPGRGSSSELHWDLILGKARDYPGRSVSRSGQV